MLSQALVELSAGRKTEDLEGGLEALLPEFRAHVEQISQGQEIGVLKPETFPQLYDQPVQLGLLDQLEPRG